MKKPDVIWFIIAQPAANSNFVLRACGARFGTLVAILKHPVANTQLCKNILRFARVFFDLTANIRHIDAQNPVVIISIRPPDLVNQCVIGHNLAGILGQQRNNLVLHPGQMDFLDPCRVTRRRSKSMVRPSAAYGRLAFCEVIAELVVVADRGADPREQLKSTKRLGYVIVRARVERLYLSPFPAFSPRSR